VVVIFYFIDLFIIIYFWRLYLVFRILKKLYSFMKITGIMINKTFVGHITYFL